MLAVQISAGGEGVDLTRARYSIFYSSGFQLGRNTSRRRPASTGPARRGRFEHIHLVARNTVDVKIMRALERRAEVVRRSSQKSRTNQQQKENGGHEHGTAQGIRVPGDGKKELDAELKAAKQRLDELEEIIIPMFIAGRRAVDDRRGRRHDAHALDLPGRICQPGQRPRGGRGRAEAVGVGPYVAENYNTNSLTSYVRETLERIGRHRGREQRIVIEADLRAALPAAAGAGSEDSLVHKLSSTKAEDHIGEKIMSQELARIAPAPAALTVSEEEAPAVQRGVRRQHRVRQHH